MTEVSQAAIYLWLTKETLFMRSGLSFIKLEQWSKT